VLRASSGAIPERAQAGLKTAWRAQRYVLACQCRPEDDLALEPVDERPELASRVVASERLTDTVFRIQLERPSGFEFHAGQFVHVVRPCDGLSRPYSIASLPSEPELELHVAVHAAGRMSAWLPGASRQPVRIRGPFGECSYVPGRRDEPLLLAGTGTGLAPLLGVLRAALLAEHRGPIRVYHGARRPSGLYAWERLCAVTRRHANVTAVGCVLSSDTERFDASTMRLRRLEEAVLEDIASIAAWRFYLSGNPAVVKRLRKQVFLAGAPLGHIHSDPFVTTPPPVAA
jgi:NAD(P)H-flavin reductase